MRKRLISALIAAKKANVSLLSRSGTVQQSDTETEKADRYD